MHRPSNPESRRESDLVNTVWIDRDRCSEDASHEEALIEPGHRIGDLSRGAFNEKVQMLLGKLDGDYPVSNGTRDEIWHYDEDGIGGRQIDIYFRKDRAVVISTSLPRYKTRDEIDEVLRPSEWRGIGPVPGQRTGRRWL